MTQWKEWAATVARIVLGGLFLWAASTKVGSLHAFAEEVANYQLVPPALVPIVATTVVGVEIVAGLLLVTGIWARAAAAVLTGLLVVFIGGLSQALVRGIDLRCGCFGGADVATWGTVWRDVAMLVPAIVVVLFGAGRLALVSDEREAVAPGPVLP